MTSFLRENIAELMLLIGSVLLGVSAFGYGGMLLLTTYIGLVFLFAGSFLAWSNINGRNF